MINKINGEVMRLASFILFILMHPHTDCYALKVFSRHPKPNAAACYRNLIQNARSSPVGFERHLLLARFAVRVWSLRLTFVF